MRSWVAPAAAVPAGQLPSPVSSTDPLVLALAVVVGLALVAGVWLLWRWYTRPPGARLRRLLAKRDEVAVLMHPNPDPDAMASAIGVQRLADDVDTECALLHPGQIRHQENRAFQTVLELDLERVEARSDIRGDAVVLVDHNRPRGFTGAEGVTPEVVIDHHPGGGEGTEFTDVRTDCGACASLVAGYFADLDATFVEDVEEADVDGLALPADVATGLLYGIQADTNHLTKGCSPVEFEASAFVYPGIDEDALERVANPQVSTDVLETKAEAIRERTVEGSFAVCDVGSVTNVDAIPQAADELLHLEGVTAVVVFGIHDGTLHLSGRSRDDRVHMGEALQAVVVDIPMASAGGHARMGGGQLSVDHMEGIGPSDGVSRDDLKNRLFAALAGDV